MYNYVSDRQKKIETWEKGTKNLSLCEIWFESKTVMIHN